MVVLFLPVVMLLAVFVVDVGNWFEHKRHLQLQADAGALAGGGSFTYPCTNDTIVERARTYAGDPSSSAPYNAQIPPTEDSNVHVLVNSGEYWNEGGADYSDGGPPCSARMVDVKITETDLPWYFQIATVPAINAHARVEVQGLLNMGGRAASRRARTSSRTSARAVFVDESTGTELASTPLVKTGTSNGMTVWDNTAAPISVPISASRIGVRIALGGGTSTTCGGRFVACYDLGSSNGLLHVRGWSPAGSGTQPNPPLARDVRLFAGSCTDPYFSTSTSSCTVGVSAVVDFGTNDPVGALGASVTAVIGGVTHPLTYDAATGRWVSTGTNLFPSPPAPGRCRSSCAGRRRRARSTIGSKLESCKMNGNKCDGTFGVVQRTFAGSEARSGAIKVAQVSEGGVAGANSFQLGANPQPRRPDRGRGEPQQRDGRERPARRHARHRGARTSRSTATPIFRTCRTSSLRAAPPTTRTTRGAPARRPPRRCGRPPSPGTARRFRRAGPSARCQQGLQRRGSSAPRRPSACSPNNWSELPEPPDGDPRIVPGLPHPVRVLRGERQRRVPVTNFATFYVTGWTGRRFEPVPGTATTRARQGLHRRALHQVRRPLNTGGGSGELCDFNAFGSCVAV